MLNKRSSLIRPSSLIMNTNEDRQSREALALASHIASRASASVVNEQHHSHRDLTFCEYDSCIQSNTRSLNYMYVVHSVTFRSLTRVFTCEHLALKACDYNHQFVIQAVLVNSYATLTQQQPEGMRMLKHVWNTKCMSCCKTGTRDTLTTRKCSLCTKYICKSCTESIDVAQHRSHTPLHNQINVDECYTQCPSAILCMSCTHKVSPDCIIQRNEIDSLIDSLEDSDDSPFSPPSGSIDVSSSSSSSDDSEIDRTCEDMFI